MVRMVFVVLAILSVSSATVMGQECKGDASRYLDEIAVYPAGADSSGLVPLLKCLSRPAAFFVEHYDSFAAPGVMTAIEASTNKDRLLVIKLLLPITRSRLRMLRTEAAAALAYYKYPPSADMLDEYPDGPEKAVLYAILGDSAMVGWVIDHYHEAERKFASDPDTLFIYEMAYLNLLYHLARPESLPFLYEILEGTGSGKVKDRAYLARERVLALHPEVK